LIFISGGIQVFSIAFSTLIPSLLLIILYLKNKIFKIDRAIIPVMFFSFIYLLYAVIIANDMEDIQFVFFRSVRFIMATLLLNFIYLKKINFIDELKSVLYWITIHGLINFVVVNLFFQYFTKIPEINTYSFLLFFGRENLDFLFSRSQGIFWEPGVFQVYLNIFLFISLFLTKKVYTPLVTIILISVLLTLSTTGIVVSFLLISYYYLISIKLTLKNLSLTILFFPLIIGLFNLVNNQVEEKISGKKSGSFLARNYDTLTGFNLAINNPWGIGFSTTKYQEIARKDLFNLIPGLETDRGNTNSIATLFYSTGILWGVIILYFMWKQSLFMKHKTLFYISIFLFLFTEPLLYTPFFILILLSGTVSSKKQLRC
tara:strand:- start:236 stop:1354 length:1119 start_codon:yes stop_codon:yes gene_type:complete